jgi:hypothetical protein
MFLSLAWSVIPKASKPPFVPYIKKLEEEEEFDFILKKVRKHLELSDNDYRVSKHRIINMIKSDMISWFSHYGIEKKYWKQYYLDFDKIKDTTPRIKQNTGLEAWGI